MGFKQIIAMFVLVAAGLYIRQMETTCLDCYVAAACEAAYYQNYTNALTTYGSKLKVSTNKFYNGNSSCFIECTLKVLKIQVQSLGVIAAPNYQSCTNGTSSKLAKKGCGPSYCYLGSCLTLAEINVILSTPPAA